MKELWKKKITKILVFAIVGIILMIIMGAVVREYTDKQKINNYIELGKKYLNDLDYERAIAEYAAALEIDPDNQDIVVLLREAYLAYADSQIEAGEYEIAIQILNRGYEQIRVLILEEKKKEVEELIAQREKEEKEKEEALQKAEQKEAERAKKEKQQKYIDMAFDFIQKFGAEYSERVYGRDAENFYEYYILSAGKVEKETDTTLTLVINARDMDVKGPDTDTYMIAVDKESETGIVSDVDFSWPEIRCWDEIIGSAIDFKKPGE